MAQKKNQPKPEKRHLRGDFWHDCQEAWIRASCPLFIAVFAAEWLRYFAAGKGFAYACAEKLMSGFFQRIFYGMPGLSNPAANPEKYARALQIADFISALTALLIGCIGLAALAFCLAALTAFFLVVSGKLLSGTKKQEPRHQPSYHGGSNGYSLDRQYEFTGSDTYPGGCGRSPSPPSDGSTDL